MLLEQYLDCGILLMQLIRVSQGREITFADKKVIVKGKSGVVHEIYTGSNGITLSSIECALEAAID